MHSDTYNKHDVGDTVRLTAVFEDAAGDPADPTTVVLKIRKPTGDVVTFTYGTDPELIRTSAGNYRLSFLIEDEGTHRYRWESTGSPGLAEEHAFLARNSDFI